MHDLDAGIADQNVDGAEGADDGRHSALDRFLVRDVHGNAERLRAGRRDLACRCLRGAEVQVRDGDVCAFAREQDCDLLADAARGACDNGCLTLQLHSNS